ncbi:hypothetical protein B0O80DRAFT_501305 [Mortierella sp. GBAus27b]|nr:hypothetical protein BGX31_006794 [Mortierella sp. GBA43]KAI8349589.1 hypothetical protein B0O80DRAFT_501305 [Mortierella sp. GBAus27b]
MAHFTLDYPLSRGFIDDNEPTAPCGGFNAVSNRTQFPLSKGFVEINSHHVTASVQVNIVYGNNPTADNFTASGATPATTFKATQPGLLCIPLELSTFKGAADNVTATIQLIYNGGDSPLYQCADVVLVTNAPSFNQSMCVNNSGSGSGSGSGTKSGATTLAKGAVTVGAAFLTTLVAVMGL